MTENILQVSDLNKTFHFKTKSVKHANHAVSDVSFDIKQGEVFGLVGESGSGKSTIANLLMNLESVDSGEIIFNGQTIAGADSKNVFPYGDIQIVFQDPRSSLDPRMSIRQIIEEPLRFVSAEKRARLSGPDNILTLIRAAGLREEHLERKPHQFSGGQRQRVAIARALINNPSIILADEPTGNLDTATSRDIMHIFGTLSEAGNTIILITHEEDIARYTRRLIRLRDGKIESDTSK